MTEFIFLKKNDAAYTCAKHFDAFSPIPSVVAADRGYKRNQAVQKPMKDNVGGAPRCLLCNPERLARHPKISLHLDDKVMSFPNAAPFFEADHRLFSLWHPELDKRYVGVHRFCLADYEEAEFCFPVLAALDRAKEFSSSPEGEKYLSEGSLPSRLIMGYNLGCMVGQSIQHFHLQAGWESIDPDHHYPNGIRRQLFYQELRDAELMLYEDENLVMFCPWAQRGRYHLQVHFKSMYWLQSLQPKDVTLLAVICVEALKRYLSVGINNVNIGISSSPETLHWQPVILDIVPRVNIAAFYENCFGTNVIDTSPQVATGFFRSGRDWREVFDDAYRFDVEAQYHDRFVGCLQKMAA
jgi:hypothetical protein